MHLGNVLLPPFVLPPGNSGARSCSLPSYPSSLGERWLAGSILLLESWRPGSLFLG